MKSRDRSPWPSGSPVDLTEREALILEAVIGNYIATAGPVGSRTIEGASGLGLSAATIRNTMSDLEAKGYLHQPHHSAGRVPTDKAYRVHVDSLLRGRRESPRALHKLLQFLQEDAVVDRVIHRTADALSILTRELGVGISPLVDEGVLQGLDLIRVSADRIMLVLSIDGGLVKTIFIELDSRVGESELERLACRLRERLAGLSLSEIRRTAAARLREAVEGERDPLNIFIQSADRLFELEEGERELAFGGTTSLADQPEFQDQGNLRNLLTLTGRRQLLLEVIKGRAHREGVQISIGGENELSELSNFTLITDTYRVGKMSGVIGVIGPTRMSYRRVISIVEHTSRLLSEMLDK